MAEKNPKVSVIIPVYNAEKHLAECLDSVVNQSLRDIEIICVDDGSTDGSLRILMEYAQRDPRIKVACKSNAGQSSARNAAMRIAAGELVCFVDAVDWIESYMLEELAQEAETSHSDMICFESDSIFDSSSKEAQNGFVKDKVRKSEYGRRIPGRQMFADMISNDEFSVSPWKSIYKRAFLQEQHIAFHEGIRHDEDLYSLKGMLLAQSASHIRKVYYHHRIGQEQGADSLPLCRDFQACFISYREMMAFILNHRFEEYVSGSVELYMNKMRKKAFGIYACLSDEEKRAQIWTDDPFTLMLFKEYEEYPWSVAALYGKVEHIKSTLPGKVMFKAYKGLRYCKRNGIMRTMQKTAQEMKRIALKLLKK